MTARRSCAVPRRRSAGADLDSPDIEILRDDLTALVTAAAGDHRTGTATRSPSSPRTSRGCDVTFESGGRGRYDFVVGADGLHSNVRGLVFGDESRFLRHLGMYVAIFTAPNFLDLDHWQTWHRAATPGSACSATGTRGDAGLPGLRGRPIDYDHHDVDQQRRLVREHCAKLRWEAPRLIEAMERPTTSTSTRWPRSRWSAGRRAGSRWWATPATAPRRCRARAPAWPWSGRTSWRTSWAGSAAGAFDRYERRLRPFVALNQALALEQQEGQGAAPENVQRAANAITLD